METRFLSIMRGKFKGVLWGTFLVVISLSLKVPMTEAQFPEAGVAKLKVPVEAPDFRLKEMNGSEVSFKQLKGKVVILNFFGTA